MTVQAPSRLDRFALKGESPTVALVLVMAALALGRAVQFSNGAWSPDAFDWVVTGLALVLVGALVGGHQAAASWAKRAFPAVVLFGFAGQFALLMTAQPGVYLRNVPSSPLPHFYYGLAVASVCAGAAIAGTGWLQKAALPVMVVTYLFLGAWTLRASPQPYIDVFLIHQDSIAALLTGKNPYTLTFPNIYGNAAFFGPGMVENGRLMFGFTYPPVSLFLAMPGYLLMHDYRYSFLVLSAAAAVLMATARPGPWPKAIAAIYLFTPRHFFVLEQGWTEPVVVFLLALTAFVACRAPRFLWVVLGLMVVSKQYVLITIPAVWCLRPLFPSWKALGLALAKGAGLAAAVSLPLALWDWPAFYRDLVGIQMGLPFRTDALSFPVWYLTTKGEHAPGWLPVLLALTGTAFVWLRAPRTVGGFVWTCAAAYLSFFFFRQAFCNYYFLALGCCCVAAAVMSGDDTPQTA